MRHSMLWLGATTVLFALACGGSTPEPQDTGTEAPVEAANGPTRVSAPRKAAKPASAAKGVTAAAPEADGKTKVALSRAAADIFRKNHDESDRELTLHLCHTAKEIVEWLIDDLQISFELATDFLYPAHSEYRMHSPPERTGAALVADLQRAVRLLPSDQYLTDINAETLVAGEDGGVEGVVITSGSREYIKAKKVTKRDRIILCKTGPIIQIRSLYPSALYRAFALFFRSKTVDTQITTGRVNTTYQ